MIRVFYILLSGYVLLTAAVQGQPLVIDPASYEYLFPPEKIKALNIKSIRMDYAVKFDLKTIRESDDFDQYHFNEDGLIKKITEVRNYGNRTDTMICEMYRNSDLLITALVKHQGKFTAVELNNYLKNRLTRQQFYQMPKNFSWNENLTSQYLMWSDSMVWQNEVTTIYNQYKRKYRSEKIFRENGFTNRHDFYDANGKWLKSIHYTYDREKLMSIEETGYFPEAYHWKKEIIYDENLVTQVKFQKNGVSEYIRKISYNKEGLPELDLSRNERTKKMTIVKITYIP